MHRIAELVSEQIQKYEIPQPTVEPSKIYFLIRNGVVVYVGQSSSLAMRVETHQRDKDFDQVLFFECSPEDVLRREMELIMALKPEYNKQAQPRRFRGNGIRARTAEQVAQLSEHIQMAEACDNPALPMKDRPVTALQLGSRATKYLIENNHCIVSDLLGLSPDDLFSIRGFGGYCLDRVRKALSSHGLHLRGEEHLVAA